mmetsp:Transcript_34480/g.101320  ORF Transcript_34480/g.101320 Transcript_34480/m.101320 type:complete len:1203 (-) Transcript_34480:13-3621(-)
MAIGPPQSAKDTRLRVDLMTTSPAAVKETAAASASASASAAAASDKTTANDHQTRLESLTLHLSSLEAQRDAKRLRLQSLGEQMQKIRSKMRGLEEELQGLDGDIDDVEGQVRRLARSHAGAGQHGGRTNGDERALGMEVDSQTQTLQYASTQLSPTQARQTQEEEEVHEHVDGDRHTHTRKSAAAATNGGGGNGYVGSTQDVGTQDMNDEEEDVDGGTNNGHPRSNATGADGLSTPRRYRGTLAPADEMLTDPPASPAGNKFGGAALTMNPDEVLTEPVPPTQEKQTKSKAKASASAVAGYAPRDDDSDEMDMIANHYDDFEGEDLVDMNGFPPPDDDFDHGFGEEPRASAFGADGGHSAAAATGASAGAGRASPADYAFDAAANGRNTGAEVRPGSSDSDVIELGTVYRADPPAAMVPSGGGSNFGNCRSTGGGGGNGGGGTLDSYFSRSGNGAAGGRQQTAANRGTASDGGILAHATSAANFDADAPAAQAASSPSFSSSHSDRPTREDRNASYMHRLARDNFSWSRDMHHHLQNTFRIQSFRKNQKEVINATMSGDDAMVLMRTGGGKSLTYQLPALIEGRGSERKVSLVISPLKSLIVDQVDQMNAFVPGSAVSFMSGLGSTEHTQRWNQVRNPDGGICLIFCTPEKVTKSNKLRGELEKLNSSGRLGRFVIDEAHCCCQWGHDFRPDYTQLGILKMHFPHVPLIAVTATASERVRDDCARILRIGTNYQLFRSTANRNNLNYSIRPKLDGAQKVIDDMVDFIKTHHPTNAGIIYCFSKKEAEDVADKLCAGGIVARPYHADISQEQKDRTQRSWQRNQTQVVVATIAFGLGINKPDVRFVLHHSLSKSMEGYYQESGRAGRDGLPADCVLYYSIKDVYRTIGMIHGKQGPTGSNGFYYMMRYAQADGDDALCKRIILSSLGEPGAEDLQMLLKNGCDRTEPREVGRHAKVAATLLYENSGNMTAAQLVTQWRSKNAPAYVKAHPPGTDLNKDECERLIVTLVLERVLDFRVIFNSYGTNTYLRLEQKGHALLHASDPKINIRLPKRKSKTSRKSSVPSSTGAGTKKKKGSAAKAKSTPSPAQPDSSGWIRSSEKKRKASTGNKGNKTATKEKKSSSRKKRTTGGSKTKQNNKKASDSRIEGDSDDDVIVLSSSDEEDDEEVIKKRPSKKAKPSSKKQAKDIFDSSSSSSESEYELE